MSSYSQTQDAVIQHLYNEGEIPNTINGRTVRSTTTDALIRRGAIGSDFKLTEDIGVPRAKSLAENIDAPRSTSQFQFSFDGWRVTYDYGTTNYRFWDKARRGDAEGLEIAGLFLKTLASKKAAWVLGQLPQFKFADSPKTETLFNDWVQEQKSDIVLAMEESANLGDMYLMINPDLSGTLIPPDVVKPIVDPKDFSKQIGWKVTQVFQHPEKPMSRMTITDEFTKKERVRTLQVGQGAGKTKRYRNPLGLVPLIHIPNNLHAGEKFGHPEGESLLKVLWNYNEIFTAGIEGNIKQGRPVPAFEKLGTTDHVKAFLKAFATTKTETLPDGTTRTYYVVDFSDMVALGDNGEFNFKSPGSFSKDTEVLLGLLFYLIIQHSEMPEFIFGNAIASSKASAESQMPPFIKWIEKEQSRAEKWLKQIVDVVLAYLSLTDVSVSGNEEYTISWSSLTEGDGKLTLEAVKWAYPQGLLSEDVAVQNLQRFMTIDDAQAMLDQLKQEREEAYKRDDMPFVPPTSDDMGTDGNIEDVPSETETEISHVVKKALSEGKHSGAMVAFEIPLDIATNLASSVRQAGLEAVAPEDMHITLAYLGDMSAIEDKKDELIEALQTLADSETQALIGSIAGIGRFNASASSDGKDVIYASFDSPKLATFRQRLVDTIEDAEVSVASNHGYTPHITLAYVENDSDMPNLALETTDLSFDKFTLYWGDERSSFKLTDNKREPVLA